MTWPFFIPLAWLTFAFFSRWLLNNPREDVSTGLLWHTCRLYARLVQRARHIGLDNLPTTRHPGPLILVSNHPSGVDPVLLASACPFEARYIMARDMRLPIAESLWQFLNIIMVDRQNRDASGTREAIRHIKDGGAVAIFPEGGIERPAQTLRPFQPGIGLLIRRANAPILPVVIRGTPVTASAWSAFWTRGRATVEFKPMIRYTGDESAQDIATDLQRRYQEWTGWPVHDPEAQSS